MYKIDSNNNIWFKVKHYNLIMNIPTTLLKSLIVYKIQTILLNNRYNK